MNKRPEYIKCIIDPNSKNKQSYCGRYVGMEFHFLDKEHVNSSIENGSRLLPCKDCLKKLDTLGINE